MKQAAQKLVDLMAFFIEGQRGEAGIVEGAGEVRGVVRVGDGVAHQGEPGLMEDGVAAVPAVASHDLIVDDADAADRVEDRFDRGLVDPFQFASPESLFVGDGLEVDGGGDRVAGFDLDGGPDVLAVAEEPVLALFWDQLGG